MQSTSIELNLRKENMAITRTKKMSQTVPKAEKTDITAEQFIAGADTSSDALPESLPVASLASREASALAVVERHLPWAAGAGILPLPGIDMALIIGVQLRMLAKLSEVYGVPFKEQAAKSMVATLMASVVQNNLAGSLSWALKFTPVLGPLIGIAVLPAVAAAATFALGKVFITHFEAGGTFLSFDPKKVSSHFLVEFEKARMEKKRTRLEWKGS
jgi:uncharacterized protein (DUF697 family)